MSAANDPSTKHRKETQAHTQTYTHTEERPRATPVRSHPKTKILSFIKNDDLPCERTLHGKGRITRRNGTSRTPTKTRSLTSNYILYIQTWMPTTQLQFTSVHHLSLSSRTSQIRAHMTILMIDQTCHEINTRIPKLNHQIRGFHRIQENLPQRNRVEKLQI